MNGQIDIGFDVTEKKWFVAFRTKNRWDKGVQYVENGNIILHNVNIDTYSYADQQNDKTSHGRFRFYSDNDVAAKGMPIPESIDIRGPKQSLEFTKVVGVDVMVKYILDGMMWEIQCDGKSYFTRDIKGCVSGTFSENPIRFKTDNVTFLHSELVTLFGTNLEIK